VISATISRKNLNWSTGFLGNRQQQVLLNGITSSKLSVDYTEESFRPNLILILAFVVMLLICGSQSSSLLIVTPKYLLLSTCCNMWLCNL
jgi:hypothetical protein